MRRRQSIRHYDALPLPHRTISRLQYCPRAFQAGDNFASSYWDKPKDRVRAPREWEGERDSYGARSYKKLVDNPQEADSLPHLVEVALDHWLERL